MAVYVWGPDLPNPPTLHVCGSPTLEVTMKFNLRAVWQNKKKKKKKPKPGGGYGFVSKLLCRIGANQFVVELEQKFSPGINHTDERTGVYLKER